MGNDGALQNLTFWSNMEITSEGNISNRIEKIIKNGHILALGGVSILLSLIFLLKLPTDWLYLALTYFGLYLVYANDRDNVLFGRPALMLPLLAIILILVWWHFSTFSLILTIILLILGLGYGRFFKKLSIIIPAFKNIFVPIPYALLILFYPLFVGENISKGVILFSIFVYLRFVTAVSFYDIKDIQADRKMRIKTFATLLTSRKHFIFLNTVNLLSFLPLIIGVTSNSMPVQSLGLIIFSVYTACYLYAAQKNKKIIHKLSYIYCDGEFILWWPILILIKFLWR